MTFALVVGAPPSPVAAVLEDLLDREWAAQSDRTAALQPTPTVRELVELTLAGTPGGLFAASIGPAGSPHELVERLREALPETLSPWTLRALRRATALRTPRAELPSTAEPPRLTPPDAKLPEDATVVESEAPPTPETPAPELPPATQELAPVAAQAPAAETSRWWPLGLALALLLGAALGCAATLIVVGGV
jgi:hypothetical protein